MPMPVSRTAACKRLSARPRSIQSSSVTVPLVVNLPALLSRLISICRSFFSSVTTASSRSGQLTTSLLPCASTSGLSGGDHGVAERAEGEARDVDAQRFVLERIDVEHVGDERQQVLACRVDATKVGLALRVGGRMVLDLLEQDFGIADDGVERGSQLMAHLGEETRAAAA